MKKSFAKYTLLTVLVLVGILSCLTACSSGTVVLSFDSMGGSACESIDLSTLEADSDIALPYPSKDGYNFLGWYEERSCQTEVSDPILPENRPTASKKYYAAWEKQVFTVSFAAGSKVITRIQKEYGKTVTASDYPALTGYTGYYWDVEEYTVVADFVIYAQKEEEQKQEIEYSVTYYVGEEVVTAYVGAAYQKIDRPLDPTAPNGSYFAGWSKKAGGTVEKSLPTYITNSDLAYYAVFVEIPDGSDYLTYRFVGSEVTITGLTAEGGYQSVIGIPSTINDYPVTAIGEKDEDGTKSLSELQVFRSSSLEKVILPASVKSIGAWAFSDCTALKDVICVGSGVTYIGKGAFAGCGSLASFSVGDNVTVVDDYAFAGITTQKNDTEAAGEVLSGLPTKWKKEKWYLTDSSLRTFQVSASSKLSQIGSYAFYRCYDLSSVVLPAVMTSVDYLTYEESGLEELTIRTAESCALKSTDGVVYSSDGKSLEYYPVCGKERYVIASGVTEVKKNAFRGNKNLTTVYFPASVVQVGNSAFCDCEKLTDVSFLSGSSLTGIGDSVFAGCTALKSITFPEKLVNFGARVFEKDTGLAEVNFSGSAVTGFGDYAFYGCTALTGALTAGGEVRSFVIPAQVTAIGNHAFENCTALSSLTFQSDAILLFVGDYAFCDCTALGKTDIPASVRYLGDYAFCGREARMSFTLAQTDNYSALQYLGSYAFANTSLTGFQLKEGYLNADSTMTTYQKETPIGKYVFKDCTFLTKMGFSSVDAYDTIPEGFAYGCTRLTDVILQQNIKKLDSYAFYGCTALKNVTFSQNTEVASQMIERIGDYAFAGCVSLLNGTDLTRVLPASLREIGVGAYEGCTSLLSVDIPENLEALSQDCFRNCTALSYITYDNPERNKMSTFGENCFAYCTSLGLTQTATGSKNIPVSLPYNLASRSSGGFVKNPFYGCSQVFSFAFPAGHNDTLENTLTVKDGIVYRDSEIYAFPTAKISTSGSANVVIPSSVSVVQEYAFYGSYLRVLEVAGDDNTIVFLKIGQYAFSGSNLTEVTIGKRVTEIGAHAFENCNLTALTIEEESLSTKSGSQTIYNVLTVGDYAFSSTTLASVVIPARVKVLGEGAFLDCYKLSSLTLKDGGNETLSIGKRVFSGDNALLDVIFPARLIKIGDGAFRKCYNVKTVTFNAGAKDLEIGAYAFAENHSLYEISLPSNVKTLGTGVFSGCTRLYYFYYPEVLTQTSGTLSIPAEAFLGDGNLKNLTIPAYVIAIGEKAFYRTNVDAVTFENGTEELTIGESAFAEAKNITALSLPDNCVEVGKDAFRASSVATWTYGSEKHNGTGLTIGEGAFAETPLRTVDINARITAVGKGAFENCTALETVTFDGDGLLMKMEDGMFRNDVKLSTVTVGEYVTEIGEEAFSESGVEEITLPSVVTIGQNAFFASALREIALTDSQKIVIGKSAFEKCTKLTRAELSSSQDVTVADFAFGGCAELETLALTGDTVSVGKGFAYSATSLYTGFSVTETGTSATHRYAMADNVLYNRSKTEIVFYPAGKTGSFIALEETVETVGAYAFYGNTYLTGIWVQYENGLTTAALGENALAETGDSLIVYTSSNLVSVYKNDWGISKVQAYSTELDSFVLTLQNSGKYYITGYLGEETSLTVPGSIIKDKDIYEITGIGKDAFRNNKKIEEVVIGSGIKTIGNGAFRSCIALRTITVGKNVTAVKNYAFYDCNVLRTVLFAADSSVSSIGDYAFAKCGALETMELPERLSSIGEYAFSYDTSLSSITMQEGLQTVKRNAFEGCVSLESVVFPAGIETLGSSVFRNCSGLIYIRVCSEVVPTIETNTFDGISDGVYYFVPGKVLKAYGLDAAWRNHIAKILSADYICQEPSFEKYVLEPMEGQEYRLVAYIGSEEDVTIYSEVSDTIRCVQIGENAFGPFVKNVHIEEGIVGIESNAFTYAVHLETVTLSYTVESIGAYAFADLTKLRAVEVIQKADYVEKTAEASAEKEAWTASAYLKYYIKNGSDYITPSDIFSETATYYKKIWISYLTEIRDHAFFNCTALERFEVPSGVKTIDEYAFSCDEDKTMNFTEILFAHDDLNGKGGASVSIGAYAFARNVKLETLTFNAYVSYVGEGAFRDCTTLVSLYLNYATDKIATYKTTDVPYGAKEIFANCDKLCIILPSGEALNAYKSAWTSKGIGTFDCNRLFEKTYVVSYSYGGEDMGEFVFSIISSGKATLISYLGNKKSVVFPSSVVLPGATTESYKVVRIGRENNGSTTYVNGNVISDTVEEVTVLSTSLGYEQTIGADAFRGCKGLKKITVEGTMLESIDAAAFKDCVRLETVILPRSLATIEKEAFAGCVSLEGYYTAENKGLSIGEPETFSANGVKLVIGESAFASCTGMTKFILLPQMNVIGNHAFDGCKNLTEVVYKDNMYDQDRGGTVLGKESLCLASIGEYAFSGTNLYDLQVPETVSSIGNYAFSACQNLSALYLYRLSSEFGNRTTTEKNVFYGITKNVIKIFVPDEKSDYANMVGWNTEKRTAVLLRNLVEVEVNGVSEKYAYEINGSATDSSTLTLTAYLGTSAEVEIPTQLTVQVSGEPKSFYAVAVSAYFGNSYMKKVVFPQDSHVTTVGAFSFAQCQNLQEIHLPGSEADSYVMREISTDVTIGEYAFENCTSLQDVHMPLSIRSLPTGIFYDCTALEELTLPASIGQNTDFVIGASAFYDCYKLARLRILFAYPLEAKTVLGASAFVNAGRDVGVRTENGKTTRSGLKIIVPGASYENYSGQWQSNNATYFYSVYSDAELFGDYLISHSQDGKDVTLVQYLGSSDVIALSDLNFSGEELTKLADGCFVGDDILVSYNDMTLRYGRDGWTLVAFTGTEIDTNAVKVLGLPILADETKETEE